MSGPSPAVQRAGPLRVDTDAALVRGFRRETGWALVEGPPPASFPVVWMRLPEIGEPIRAAAQEIGLPVHEAQQFDYIRPLELDHVYELMLEMRRETHPSRLIATAEVFEPGGALVARVISTMRLIDPADVPAPAPVAAP